MAEPAPDSDTALLLDMWLAARDAEQAGRLYQLGATDVVPETIEASLRLSEALLSRIGMPPDAVVASIRQRRDEFRHQAGNAETANRQGRRAPQR
ncbi:MAG: hypothetical protein GEV13_10010 [Rhodospirillales bacterium]|nr:hypothetical protein [Rhodospirillales bacterium]